MVWGAVLACLAAQVFTAVVCERSVVVCSKHIALLTPVLETIRALLFPFDWQMSYFPILYGDNGGYMESPSQYLFGYYGT